MAPGQLVGFGISVVMIAVGVVLCLFSVYDRMKNAEEQARRIAEELVKRLGKKEGITTSPIPLGELDDIIAAIMKIQHPSMQVGVFFTVFGILVMIISIFIPF